MSDGRSAAADTRASRSRDRETETGNKDKWRREAAEDERKIGIKSRWKEKGRNSDSHSPFVRRE